MIFFKVGRYAALIQLLAAPGALRPSSFPVVDAAASSSFIRGRDAAAAASATNEPHRLDGRRGDATRPDGRSLQAVVDCLASQYQKNNKSCPDVCLWIQGTGCVPLPTSTPTTAPPTPPVTPPPTNSPSRAGAGYCSDDVGRQCFETSECSCGGGVGGAAVNLFGRRELQDPCTAAKKKDCPESGPNAPCLWVGGTGCVPAASPPSPPPTQEPTKAPTPCACLGLPPGPPTDSPTKQPTGSPFASPTKSPSSTPTDGPTSSPSKSPSSSPTTSPIEAPTSSPVISTPPPTSSPINPTNSPTTGPSTGPTSSPVRPTTAPTSAPSKGPSPTPVTDGPMRSPTSSPLVPTNAPTGSPSKGPSPAPISASPTGGPTASPTKMTEPPTKVPTGSPSKAPVTPAPVIPFLNIVGDNGSPTEAFPLGNCEGDCDNDGNCEAPLLCYQRSGTEATPGCTGLGVSGKDYCALRAPDSLFLRIAGGAPSGNIPLGPCDGDCGTDADCNGPMICYELNAQLGVPGCNGVGVSGHKYCQLPVVQDVGSNGVPVEAYPLSVCEGQCVSDVQCLGDLKCFWRAGNLFPIPGCLDTGTQGTDYCAARPTENTVFLTGDNNNPPGAFPLGLCEGDCDGDSQCEQYLTCQQRGGNEAVSGCLGSPTFGEDYCRYPDAVIIANPPPLGSLGACEGDCDTDADCDNSLAPGTLRCYQRSSGDPIPGCIGGSGSSDYCANRPTLNTLFLTGQNGAPAANFPLGLCEGDCDNDSECGAPASGLACFQRGGLQEVPGCEGSGVSGKDYCYSVGPTPTTSPTPPLPPTTSSPTNPKPTYAPNNYGATYVPGDLSVACDSKVTMSRGMACAKLTTAGQFVQYANGNFSSITMHPRADGAGVIPHPTDGGWYYVSNAEASSGSRGGAGTLRFNAQGQVIGYEQTLTGTSRNCGGGLTYWNTWVSCEENGSAGQCHEVDPFTGYTKQVKVVAQGGNYESFAYDNNDPAVEARFFTTEDSSTGALVRYTPDPSAFGTGNNYIILDSPNGVHDYLVLNANGTFYWSLNIVDGEASANTFFPNSEGIDCHNRILNFVSKAKKELFTLNLDDSTWSKSSTVSGAFNLQPDQLGRILGDSEVLYFCEDGGSACDVHARDSSGQYYTIIRGDGYSTETTGLAFSPNNKFMYMAFQAASNVYAFWREDGLPFNGLAAYTKYHAT